MKKRIRVLLSLLVAFTMIFTMGVTAMGEIVEGDGEEEKEEVREEVDEPVDPLPAEEIQPEPDKPQKPVDPPKADKPEPPPEPAQPESPELPEKPLPPVEPEIPVEVIPDKDLNTENPPQAEIPKAPPTPELEEEIEDLPIAPEPVPVLVIYPLSINAQVMPSSEIFTNGEDLTYDIRISNNGDLDLYNISVQDDLGLSDTVSYLSPGQEITISGSYSIDEYNELEKMANSVDIYGTYEEGDVSMNISFVVDIEIPKGSLEITNSVDRVIDRDEEFDIFIYGPNNTEYTVSLKDGESKTLENLWMGDYLISSVVPMNYSFDGGDTSVSLSINNLDLSSRIYHSLSNDKMFYDIDDKEESLFSVSSSDIDQVEVYSLKEISDNRSDSIYIEIEVWEIFDEGLDLIFGGPGDIDIPQAPSTPIEPSRPDTTDKKEPPKVPEQPKLPDKPEPPEIPPGLPDKPEIPKPQEPSLPENKGDQIIEKE